MTDPVNEKWTGGAAHQPVFVNWWAKDDETGRAAAGGFYRCDTPTEYVEFMQDATARGLALQVVLNG